ncbi:MAG: hypothetical protein Tsb0015_07910 [Simkaniaceae bacterium]
MWNKNTFQKFNKILFFCTNWAALIIGALSVLGWLLNLTWIVQPLSMFLPIQFDASLSIALLAASQLLQTAAPLSRLLGLAGFAIAFLSIGSQLQWLDFSLNRLISSSFSPILHRDYMAFITAIGLSIGGVFITLFTAKKSSLLFLLAKGLGAMFVVSVGMFSTLSFFVPINIAFQTKPITPIAPQTALCLMLMGIGMLSAIYKQEIQLQHKLNKWSPILFAILLLLVNIFVFFGLRSQHNIFSKAILEAENERLQIQIQDHFLTLFGFLEWSSLTMENENYQFSDVLLKNAEVYLKYHPAFSAFVWIGKDYTLEKSTQLYSPYLGQQIFSEKQGKELFQPDFNNRIKVSLVPFAPAKKEKILVYIPIFQKGEFLGSLAIIINPKSFFDHIIKYSKDYNYLLTISHDHKLIYKTHLDLPSEYELEDVMHVHDHFNLCIKLTPLHPFTLIHAVPFIWFIFLGGILISAFVGIIIYLWIQTLKHLKEIDEMQEQMDLALSSADMGTWSFNTKNHWVTWDTYSSKLLGLPSQPFSGPLEEFLQLVHPEDREVIFKGIEKVLKTGEITTTEHRIVWPDGSIHYINLRGTTHNGLISGVSWDVTEIKENRRIIDLEYQITNILKNSSSLVDSGEKILQAICQNLGWEAALFWFIGENQQILECKAAWQEKGGSLSSSAKKIHLQKNAGIAGKVWRENRIFIIKDNKNYREEPLIAEAIADGLQAAIGIPIIDRETFIGVIEIHRMIPIKKDLTTEFTNYLISLGTSLAQFYRKVQVEKKQHFLASIVESSSDAIISKDLEGNILNWNRGAEEMFGYAAEEVIGKSILQFIPPDKQEETQKMIRQLKEGKSFKNFESVCIAKDGSLIPVLITYSPIRNEKNEIMGSCAIVQNIEKMKKAQKSLQESEEKFRAFVETTTDWVWSIDLTGKITYSNPSITSILGYSVEELLNNDMNLFVFAEDRPVFEKNLENCISHRKGWNNQTLRWIHKNGSVIWLESNSEPNMDAQGQFVGLLGVDRDITERKKMEKIKNEFISMISHELRTPLTSIQGSIGLILGKMSQGLSDPIKKLLNIASNNCKRLIFLVNDILDIEKIEAGKFQLQLSPVDLVAIVRESVEANRSYAEKFHIKIQMKTMPEKAIVQGDYGRLMQVMGNLLSNAIKFSSQESEVYVSLEETPNTFRVSVQDFGKGIPEDFKPKIFEKFEQADPSSKRKHAGTGLGLPICKNIIEQHGGTLSFSSEVDEGSTFTFVLPKANR